MASFLTALANIGSQYAEGRTAGLEEKEKLAQLRSATEEGRARLGLEQSQQELARQTLALREKEFAAQPDIIPIDLGKGRKVAWSVSKQRLLNPDELPGSDPNKLAMQSIQGWINQQPKEDQAKLTQTATSYAGAGAEPDKILTDLRQDAKNYQTERDKLRPKMDPIIAAQIGPRPDSTQFRQGENDPAYQAALKIWGANAETVKTRMAEAMSEARGKGYGEWRPGGFLDNEGQLHSGYWGQAIAQGWVPAPQAFHILPRQVQMAEMMDASANLRTALNNLQPGDAFTTASVAQMRAALGTIDTPYVPGIFSKFMNNAATASLNPRQMDYLIALGQMGERILSVRNVAGMGVGAQDLREAIQSTLPGVTSGSKEYALARLNAVDQLLSRLSTGIPRTNINVPPMTPTPPGTSAAPGTSTLPGPTEMNNAIDQIIKQRTQRKAPEIEQPVAPAGEQ